MPDHHAVLVDGVHPVEWDVRHAFIALEGETVATTAHSDRREWNDDIPVHHAIAVGQCELPLAEFGVPSDAIE